MKQFLPLFCAGVLTAGSLYAQKPIVLQSPDVLNEYQVTGLSPNGKWACGNINDGYYRGFIWNLVTGEVRELSSQAQKSTACAVSNNGVVAGFFEDDDATDNHATIEVAGYWANGSWHHVEHSLVDVPTDATQGSIAFAISPNGKLMGGAVNINKKYVPVSWNIETGEMTQYINNADGVIYGIADNGVATGWTTQPEKKNRTACIWASPTDSIMPMYDVCGPWAVAGNISSDGTKALLDGGVYDLTTKSYKRLIDTSKHSAYDFYRINNNGTIVGYYEVSFMNYSAAIIKDGVEYELSDYLTGKGVDLSKYPSLVQAIGIDDDENTITAIVYDADNVPRSIAVRFNQNTTNPAPVALKAEALAGAGAVKLSWLKPLANEEAVKNYQLYRGSELVYTGTDSVYIDKNLADGNYEYTVKAVYEASVSDASEAATATLAPVEVASARSFTAAQRGLNNVNLYWEKPLSNDAVYSYYPEGGTIVSIGGGSYSFESGVRYDSELLSTYAAKGLSITGVNFYPMSTVKGWKVNIYDAADLKTKLYSQDVAPSSLVNGQNNYVQLTTPFAIPAGKDIVIGVEADVYDNASSYSVQGMYYGICKPGYTDLMHRVNMEEGSEEDFYCMYDRCRYPEKYGDDSDEAGYMYETAWATGISFGTAESSANQASSYILYADGQKVATTSSLTYMLKGQTDGEHTYAVSPVYADNTEGPKSETKLTVAADRSAFTAQNVQVFVSGNDVKATWNAVKDDNRKVLQFCSDTNTGGVVGTQSNNYSYAMKTLYEGSDIRPYDGEQITAVRFYPLADAVFTLYVEKDGTKVVELEVDDFTTGTWNEVQLPTPIALDRNSEYALIVDAYDVAANEAPLGMDDQLARQGVTDLYSDDGNMESWTSLSASGESKNANWMMGLVLGTTESTDLGVKGYNVLIDGKQHNADMLTTTEYSTQIADEGRHLLKVRTLFNDDTNTTSATTAFVINTTSGINDVTADAIQVSADAQTIVVTGTEVTSLTLYSATGAKVAAASGNVLPVAGMAKGAYVLSIAKADGTTMSRKLVF